MLFLIYLFILFNYVRFHVVFNRNNESGPSDQRARKIKNEHQVDDIPKPSNYFQPIMNLNLIILNQTCETLDIDN